MARYTTGHLNEIAKVIYAERCKATGDHLQGINTLAYALGKLFEGSNPQFSIFRFIGACMDGIK